mmetsp:Transcript_42371/g.92148  ORF Transcript_42371/g.92148 Transcript_42371/m.92148 type:complete len:103 (+) Transcript_42371:323-631(+)
MRHVAHGARVGHLDRAWSLAGLTPADPSDGTFLAACSESLLDVAVALGLGSQLHALVVSDSTLPALRWLAECNLVVLPPTNHVFVHPSANPDFSWAADSGSQ